MDSLQGETKPHHEPIAEVNTHQDTHRPSSSAGEVTTLEGQLPAERLKKTRDPKAIRRASEAPGDDITGRKRLPLQLTGSEETEKVIGKPQIDQLQKPVSDDSSCQHERANPRQKSKPVRGPGPKKGGKSSKHALRRARATAQKMAPQEEGEQARTRKRLRQAI